MRMHVCNPSASLYATNQIMKLNMYAYLTHHTCNKHNYACHTTKHTGLGYAAHADDDPPCARLIRDRLDLEVLLRRFILYLLLTFL